MKREELKHFKLGLSKIEEGHLMDIMQYISEQALVLIPVLYVLGMFFKASKLPDNYIPLMLLFIGILLAIFLLGFTAQALTQGILVAGAAVFANQMVKQINKME